MEQIYNRFSIKGYVDKIINNLKAVLKNKIKQIERVIQVVETKNENIDHIYNNIDKAVLRKLNENKILQKYSNIVKVYENY